MEGDVGIDRRDSRPQIDRAGSIRRTRLRDSRRWQNRLLACDRNLSGDAGIGPQRNQPFERRGGLLLRLRIGSADRRKDEKQNETPARVLSHVPPFEWLIQKSVWC